MLKKIRIFFKCRLMESHNWTCDELEDNTPGFWNYAKIFCKDCGKKDKIRVSE